MNTGTELPRRGTGAGCFGKSCLVFLGLLVFLGVAFVGGGFWALRHLQKTYSSEEPLAFANITSAEPALDAGPETAAAPNAVQIDSEREVSGPPASAAQVRARWRAFERAADRHEKARVELTADDINTLLENDPKLRGKAAVSIQNNVARVRVSVPLGELFMMNGRYLNGEATVEPSPDGKPENARISNIILGSQAVPDDMLDRRMFGWTSIRGYMTEWLSDNEIAYFNIENNRVVGETRGNR